MKKEPHLKKVSLLGSGWLGLALAKRLKSQSYSVATSTRSTDKLESLSKQGLNPFLIDLSQNAKLPSAFFDSDVLIVSITSKELEYHERVADYIHASPIKQIVYTSSTSVYPADSQQVKESSIIQPEHPLIKIEQFYQGLKPATCILRLAGLVGPDRHPGRFFRKRPHASIANIPSNLVHLQDILPVFDWFLENLPMEEVYNVASDEHPPKFGFYSAAYEDFTAQKAQFQLDETRTNKGGKIVSNEKLKAASGLSFKLADYYPYVEA